MTDKIVKINSKRRDESSKEASRPTPSLDEGLRRIKERAKKVREQYSPSAPEEDEPTGLLLGGPENLELPSEDDDEEES